MALTPWGSSVLLALASRDGLSEAVISDLFKAACLASGRLNIMFLKKQYSSGLNLGSGYMRVNYKLGEFFFFNFMTEPAAYESSRARD